MHQNNYRLMSAISCFIAGILSVLVGIPLLGCAFLGCGAVWLIIRNKHVIRQMNGKDEQ